MENSMFQCYECGWSGDDPDIEEHEEQHIIEKGWWVTHPACVHYLCPDCKNIFAIINK